MNINFNNFTFDFFQGEGSAPPPLLILARYTLKHYMPDASGIVKNVTFSFLYLKMFLEP